MTRDSGMIELAIAKLQAKAAGERLAGPNGLKEQEKSNTSFFGELVSGTLCGLFALVSVLLLISDRTLGLYSLGLTAVCAIIFSAVVFRKRSAIRRKREQDLRDIANEKRTSDKVTETENA